MDRMSRKPVFLLGLLLSLFVWLVCFSAAYCQALPAVSITSVKANFHSVKFEFLPVPGAADYRVYDVNNPNVVKYAGIWHLDADTASWPYNTHGFVVDSAGNPTYPLATINYGSPTSYHHADIPALEIEWNGVTKAGETLVVQAVNELGPAPYLNLYRDTAAGINQPANGVGGILGSDAGPMYANPGITVINGQGSYTNNPQVIAQSQPFTVAASGVAPIPSTSSATQAVFCAMPSGAAAPYDVISPGNNYGTGIETTTLTTPTATWDIRTKAIDTNASSPAIATADGQISSVLFDSDHVGYGSTSFSPTETFDISNGQIGHATFEVDAHDDGRRWVALAITPAADPLTGFELPSNPGDSNVDSTGNWVFWQWNALHGFTINEGYGLSGPNGFTNWGIVGAAGQAEYDNNQRVFTNYQSGHGLDNRSRFDVFFSQTHFAIYEDGVLESSYDFPKPLSFSQVRAYFNAYMYHSALEQQELAENAPYETYWRFIMPSSDERHWANAGVEVLPAGTAWSSLGSLITMPQAVPPVYVPVDSTATGHFCSVDVNQNGKIAIAFKPNSAPLITLTQSTIPLTQTAAADCLSDTPATITYQGSTLLAISGSP